MDMYSCLVVLCAIFGVLLHCGGAQNVHIVGDGMGWNIPSTDTAYTNWASAKTFTVGDILVFNFSSGRHDVLQVPQSSYEACTQQNPIGPVSFAAPTNITLTSTGDHYYICTIGSHCQLGQRLAIIVSGGANSPTNSPPPNTSTPATPSPVPNHPGAGGPAATSMPPSSRSTSTSLTAGFLLCLVSIGIAMII